MATVKIPCPHCNRLCALDQSKLPNKPVAFNCPGCSGKVMVDPARLGGVVSSAAVSAPAPVKAASPPEALTPDTPAPVSTSVEKLELPAGAALPGGLLFGDRGRVTEELRRALGPHGCTLEKLDDPGELADRAVAEIPPLLVFVTQTAGRPPLDLLQPLARLTPAARRRTFVVLVADNLNTLDGSQAFFYNVNLVLSARDVGAAASVLFAAMEAHRRLAGPLLEALDEAGLG